jgi:hypothetical protein
MYTRERRDAESATDFFARVDVTDVALVLRDLQKMTEADAVPLDYVDLAETGEFAPEIMEGECSA